MSLNDSSLNFLLSLWKDGNFKGSNSVIELGSQHLSTAGADVALVINNLAPESTIKESDIKDARDVYKALGFPNYKCIDTDGRHDALYLDLNEDIHKKGLNEQFDLVTNFGTSEHCFDQYHCFMNIHNLCKDGGMIIHIVPMHGGLNHGFFNYHPDFFFSLAAANNYKMLGIHFNYGGGASLTPYSDTAIEFMKSHSEMCIFVAFQKMNKNDFRSPWDHKYIGTCEFPKYQFQKTNQFFLPIARRELSAWDHLSALIQLVRKVGFLSSIKRFIFWKFRR